MNHPWLWVYLRNHQLFIKGNHQGSCHIIIIIRAYIESTFELWLHSVTIYGTKKQLLLCSVKLFAKLTDLKRRHVLRRTVVPCLSNVTAARIAISVVTRCHIQKLMQAYLPWRTTFHLQTVITDTFRTYHTADKSPLA